MNLKNGITVFQPDLNIAAYFLICLISGSNLAVTALRNVEQEQQHYLKLSKQPSMVVSLRPTSAFLTITFQKPDDESI